MTKNEFLATGFNPGQLAEYEGELHKVGSVSFTEMLFGLVDKEDPNQLWWVRCESINLVEPQVISITGQTTNS